MGVKILSLFDGMACGMIAMQLAGVEVESYDAYEIDKYAIKTAQHNFPMIKEHGDVFKADFTQYEGVDFLVGGSPCTYWSIAQTKNRETVASGMGWELFSQYVRALHEAKPKYFIYENNKSMSKQIRASIDEAFGFEAVLINSALVSAQNRQRLYWVGMRNEDGTYSKVNVEQPADRGILLKDVLDSAVARDLTSNDKAYTLTASYDGACAWNTIERHQRNMVAEPINTDANGKAFCVTARYYKGFGNNPGKCLEKHRDSMAAEPVCVAERGRMYCGQPQHYEARTDGKTNTLTSVEKDNRVAEPVSYCTDKNMEHLMRNFGSKGKIVDEESKTPTLMAAAGMGGGNHIYYANSIAEPINDILQVGAMPRPDGEISTSAGFRIYSTEAKGRYLCANGGGAGAKTGLYAIPYSIEFDQVGAMPLDGFIPGERTVGSQMEFLGGVNGSHEKWLEDGKNYSRNFSQGYRLYGVNGKAVTQTAQACGYAGNTGLYAVPHDCDVVITENSIRCQRRDQKHSTVQGSHVNFTDGKTQTLSPSHIPNVIEHKSGKEITIYEVKDGKITIKGKQYPIKLKDGYYIIRKLTVSECKRLQTVPEWYEFPVSNSQAYKMLGNGWTCEVIAHLIRSCMAEQWRRIDG